MATYIDTVHKAWQWRRRPIFRFHREFSSERDSGVKCKKTTIGQVSEMELITGGSQGSSPRKPNYQFWYMTMVLKNLQLTLIYNCNSKQIKETSQIIYYKTASSLPVIHENRQFFEAFWKTPNPRFFDSGNFQITGTRGSSSSKSFKKPKPEIIEKKIPTQHWNRPIGMLESYLVNFSSWALLFWFNKHHRSVQGNRGCNITYHLLSTRAVRRIKSFPNSQSSNAEMIRFREVWVSIHLSSAGTICRPLGEEKWAIWAYLCWPSLKLFLTCNISIHLVCSPQSCGCIATSTSKTSSCWHLLVQVYLQQ